MKKLFTSKKIRIAAVILLVAEMLVIFAFSAQEGMASRAFSNLIGSLLHAEETTRNDLPDYNGPFGIGIRKYGHFAAFALLGVFAYLSGKVRSKRLIRLLIALGICVAYAVFDELHQYFTPGRQCALRDMLIDSAGSLSGCLIMLGLDFSAK